MLQWSKIGLPCLVCPRLARQVLRFRSPLIAPVLEMRKLMIQTIKHPKRSFASVNFQRMIVPILCVTVAATDSSITPVQVCFNKTLICLASICAGNVDFSNAPHYLETDEAVIPGPAPVTDHDPVVEEYPLKPLLEPLCLSSMDYHSSLIASGNRNGSSGLRLDFLKAIERKDRLLIQNRREVPRWAVPGVFECVMPVENTSRSFHG